MNCAINVMEASWNLRRVFTPCPCGTGRALREVQLRLQLLIAGLGGG